MKKQIILFLDSGDTFVDESSEVRDERGIVIRAELTAGAKEALLEVKSRGYRMLLVADGDWESFDNVYRQHGLEDLFEARVISEQVGAEKPAPLMFQTAMELAGLSEAEKSRILMVGNNIKRDIAGAGRFGIRSALMNWSPRYPMVPESIEETPDYIISGPAELLVLAERLEKKYEKSDFGI